MNILKLLLVRQNRVSWMVFYSSCLKNGNIIKKIFVHRLENKYHIIVGKQAKIGKGIYMPHPQNIVIGGQVRMGERTRIYQDVTLGQNRNAYPLIGDDVIIYPGAKVIGNITIGNKAVIGANAVVIKDVLENEIVAGVPARCIGIREDIDEFY
ncbi:MAG: hypothetical protein KHY95_05885 [Lachnospiraceae bacterium]|jgi:serine O-acetyltransferase|nr:hypothetical protein [Lachnospiraceae bacterium]